VRVLRKRLFSQGFARHTRGVLASDSASAAHLRAFGSHSAMLRLSVRSAR
jgi:hypothetical protein